MFKDKIFGVIYIIKHKTDDTKRVYIGSTINLKERIWKHKSSCNNEKNKNYNNKIYQYLRENGGFIQYEFIILECYVCNFKHELLCKEDDYIKMYDNNLNQLRAYLTDEEHKMKNNEKSKKYYDDNKEKIKEEYNENKDIFSQRRKKYHEKNKDIINEKKKEKYNENKEKINEQRKEKITCECGSIVRKTDITRHCKSLKHIAFIEKK